jgi:hypothetical protein
MSNSLVNVSFQRFSKRFGEIILFDPVLAVNNTGRSTSLDEQHNRSYGEHDRRLSKAIEMINIDC